MSQLEVVVKKLRCLRCGHEWIPNKTEKPRLCPACHSPYWDRSRLLKGAPKGRLSARQKKVPNSMFGVSPDLPSFNREEDDFRI